MNNCTTDNLQNEKWHQKSYVKNLLKNCISSPVATFKYKKAFSINVNETVLQKDCQVPGCSQFWPHFYKVWIYLPWYLLSV